MQTWAEDADCRKVANTVALTLSEQDFRGLVEASSREVGLPQVRMATRKTLSICLEGLRKQAGIGGHVESAAGLQCAFSQSSIGIL